MQSRNRLDPLLIVALVATFALLAVHAWSTRFLTDDAFISFRYARNLARGLGLVFNPGFERVEGFTNLLWVLALAGFSRIGVPPERAAHLLSLLATVGLWAVVAWFAARLSPSGRARWFAVIAPLALAVTRSVAVWSTSGLETRLFELLVVSATLRWIVELERWRAGEPSASLAPWLFGLAALTRPEGFLFAMFSLGLGGPWLARSRRLQPPRFAWAWMPFAMLVLGQMLFRWFYYHDWLPNTWYAKVGGALWWSSGLRYLAAFILEYALWLWIPIAIVGAAALVRRQRGLVPLIFAGSLVPYTIYVVAVGGDHFEYRLLDVAFPFLFLLAGVGWSAWFDLRRARWVSVAFLAIGLVGLWELPNQAHRQFPDVAAVGFPGLMIEQTHDARAYLDPARSPFYRWPGLRAIAAEHRDLVRWLTRHFVGIRQEEHARFAVAAVRDGRTLRMMVARALLPSDTYLATGAVGAIPYESELRVLDMQGLTDREVARSAPRRNSAERMMAHDRTLEWSDAIARGVDLISVDASPLLSLTSDAMLSHVREAVSTGDSVWAADVGQGFYLVALLPRGPEAAARRMPRLQFERLASDSFVSTFFSRSIAAWQETLAVRPTERRARLRLAWLLLAHEQYDAARQSYLVVTSTFPEELEAWDGLAWCEVRRGHWSAARAALIRAIELARAQEESAHLHDLEVRLAGLPPASP